MPYADCSSIFPCDDRIYVTAMAARTSRIRESMRIRRLEDAVVWYSPFQRIPYEAETFPYRDIANHYVLEFILRECLSLAQQFQAAPCFSKSCQSAIELSFLKSLELNGDVDITVVSILTNEYHFLYTQPRSKEPTKTNNI